MLFKVVQDGPEVEAEEGVRVAGFVIKFLYLKVEGGQFKQTAVLPEKKKKKSKKRNENPMNESHTHAHTALQVTRMKFTSKKSQIEYIFSANICSSVKFCF